MNEETSHMDEVIEGAVDVAEYVWRNMTRGTTDLSGFCEELQNLGQWVNRTCAKFMLTIKSDDEEQHHNPDSAAGIMVCLIALDILLAAIAVLLQSSPQWDYPELKDQMENAMKKGLEDWGATRGEACHDTP